MIRIKTAAKTTIGAALVTLLAFGAAAEAREYNQRQHLAPAERAKIQGIIAYTTAMQATSEDKYRPGDLRPCSDLNIGSTPQHNQYSDPYAPQHHPHGSPHGQQPSEQTIITGDIYNIDGNCFAEPAPTGPGF